MIHYFCPDLQVRSSGMRRLYRHVQILSQHGIPATILHAKQGFTLADMPVVPVRYLDVPGGAQPRRHCRNPGRIPEFDGSLE